MKPNFIYQSYDYSFLQPKNAYNRLEAYFPQAVRAAASTIGFDVATVEPMNEPVGQLFYFEPTVTATTTTDGGQITATTAVYEPVTSENISDRIRDVSNYIANTSTRWHSNYIVTNSTVSNALNNSRNHYFARRNFFKNLRSKKHK